MENDDAVLMGDIAMLSRVEELLDYVTSRSASAADAGGYCYVPPCTD